MTDELEHSVPPRTRVVRGWFRRFLKRSTSHETIATAVALVGIAVLWPWPWAVAALGAILIAIGVYWVSRESARSYWTGRFLAVRLVLVTAAVIAFAQDRLLWGVVGTLSVGAGVVTGGIIRSRMMRLSRPPAVNVSSVRGFDDMLGWSRGSHAAVGAAVVATLVGQALRSEIVAVVAGAVALAVTAVFVALAIRNTAARRGALREAQAALASLEPQFLLHWDAPSEGTYQVAMWVPYLKRLGVPFAIVVRTSNQLRALDGLVDVPVFYRVTAKEIERTLVPSVHTIFYVNTALRNAHYLRFNHLRHIQLNHGDSDKPASASRQFRAYDKNFVAGQAAVDRFGLYGIDMPETLVRIVGRPQVEPIVPAALTAGPAQTVLYAPTWGGYFSDSDLSSLSKGEALVQFLLDRGNTVIFRPHAFTDRHAHHAEIADRIRQKLAQDAQRTGRRHLWGPAAEQELSVFECFNVSDAMISDVSSIVTDYLFSEKPLVMMAVGMEPDEFSRTYPVSRAAYVIPADSHDFESVLSDALGADSLRPVRRSLRDYYLGDFPAEGYADVFVAAAQEELDFAARGHRFDATITEG